MKKPIKLILYLSYFRSTVFNSNTDCPVARACKKHFKPSFLYVYTYGVNIDGETYKIKDEFLNSDYNYVKEQYKKYPGKYLFYVTLIPQ